MGRGYQTAAGVSGQILAAFGQQAGLLGWHLAGWVGDGHARRRGGGPDGGARAGLTGGRGPKRRRSSVGQDVFVVKAERIIGHELKRLKWSGGDLAARRKGDPAKLELAARLRRETTLTVRQIAERLHTGAWQSLNNKLYLRHRKKEGAPK